MMLVKNSLVSKVVLVIFLLIIFILLFTFFCSQLLDASNKPLWRDEWFGLKVSVGSASYAGLLLRGAAGQATPAPLDYLAVKFFDQIKEAVNYFSLPPRAYFRLFSNLAALFGLLLIVALFALDIQRLERSRGEQLAYFFLLICVLVAYLYNEFLYFFAAEARPYALWTILWFMSAALFLLE